MDEYNVWREIKFFKFLFVVLFLFSIVPVWFGGMYSYHNLLSIILIPIVSAYLLFFFYTAQGKTFLILFIFMLLIHETLLCILMVSGILVYGSIMGITGLFFPIWLWRGRLWKISAI